MEKYFLYKVRSVKQIYEGDMTPLLYVRARSLSEAATKAEDRFKELQMSEMVSVGSVEFETTTYIN